MPCSFLIPRGSLAVMHASAPQHAPPWMATTMLAWMLASSVLIGSFATGMTPLLHSASHYTVSWTRVASAWHMASWMGAAELAMLARMRGRCTRALALAAAGVVASGALSLLALRSQAFVGPQAWAARMVEHHSTAMTTSQRLLAHPDCVAAAATSSASNSSSSSAALLCALAASILARQGDEIAVLRASADVDAVTAWTAAGVAAVAGPVAAAALAWSSARVVPTRGSAA